MDQQIIHVAVVEDDSRLRRTFTDILDADADADACDCDCDCDCACACDCVGECECECVFATGQQAIRGIPPLAADVLIMMATCRNPAALNVWPPCRRNCPTRRF